MIHKHTNKDLRMDSLATRYKVTIRKTFSMGMRMELKSFGMTRGMQMALLVYRNGHTILIMDII
jgi:hypothetical protein